MNDAMMNDAMTNDGSTHTTENRIAKLEKIMAAKQNIWRAVTELNMLILDDDEQCEMIESAYPFNESLSDIAIHEWCEINHKELKAYDIVKRVMEFMNISNRFDRVHLNWANIEELYHSDEWDRVNLVRTILLDSVPELYQMLK